MEPTCIWQEPYSIRAAGECRLTKTQQFQSQRDSDDLHVSCSPHCDFHSFWPGKWPQQKTCQIDTVPLVHWVCHSRMFSRPGLLSIASASTSHMDTYGMSNFVSCFPGCPSDVSWYHPATYLKSGLFQRDNPFLQEPLALQVNPSWLTNSVKCSP